MCKKLRYKSLLLLSVLTLYAALPTVTLAETYESLFSMMTEVTSEEDVIISENNSQLATVQFTVIADATLKISYADGRVDLLEKRYDGVYLLTEPLSNPINMLLNSLAPIIRIS